MTNQRQEASPQRLGSFLGKGENALLQDLGYDNVPTDHNPVWEALAGLCPLSREDIQAAVEAGEMTAEEGDRFHTAISRGASQAESLKAHIWNGSIPNKRAVLTAYALCQTACLNPLNGPVGTGDLGTIRQRWYFSKSAQAMGFKFASQALEGYLIESADVVLVDDRRTHARAKKQGAGRIEYKSAWDKEQTETLKKELGRSPRIHIWPKKGWGRAYAQSQSAIFADLVRDGLTYDELWVRDASRDVSAFSPIVADFHGALLLEKEGLFEHFQPICKATGVPVLMAMSGVNAFAAVEATLNDRFRKWGGQYTPTKDNPLHLFVISDHDYYGFVPVQEGAALQFERYVPVEVHRVGITPEQLREQGRSPVQAGYEFEADYNKATKEWADEEGIWVGDTCYAIEVEALEPTCFVEALIAAVVEALGGGDALRDKLMQFAEPDWYQVQDDTVEQASAMSELIRRLQALEQWSHDQAGVNGDPITSYVWEDIRPGQEDAAWRSLPEVQEAIANALEEAQDEIDLGDFASHVEAERHGPWRPVDDERATEAAKGVYWEHREDALERLAQDADTAPVLQMLRVVFGLLYDDGLRFE